MHNLEKTITPLDILSQFIIFIYSQIVNRLYFEMKQFCVMSQLYRMKITMFAISISEFQIPVYETLLNLSENEPYSDSFGAKQLNKYINQLNVSTDHK